MTKHPKNNKIKVVVFPLQSQPHISEINPNSLNSLYPTGTKLRQITNGIAAHDVVVFDKDIWHSDDLEDWDDYETFSNPTNNANSKFRQFFEKTCGALSDPHGWTAFGQVLLVGKDDLGNLVSVPDKYISLLSK